jgi:hypothetical protein
MQSGERSRSSIICFALLSSKIFGNTQRVQLLADTDADTDTND